MTVQASPPAVAIPHAYLGIDLAGGGESGVVASVLATTGELARVAGPGLRTHIGDVLPLIIEAIQDSTGGNKRLTAVSTLGQVDPGLMPSETAAPHDASQTLQHRPASFALCCEASP